MKIYTHKNTARIADAAYKAAAAKMMDCLSTGEWDIYPWDRWVPNHHKDDGFTPKIAAEVRDELGWKDCEVKTGRFAPTVLQFPDKYEFKTRTYSLQFYYDRMVGWSCYLYSMKDKVSYVLAFHVPENAEWKTGFDNHLNAFIHLTKALRVLE